MKQFKLSGSLRENVGRQDASALQVESQVFCTVVTAKFTFQ